MGVSKLADASLAASLVIDWRTPTHVGARLGTVIVAGLLAAGDAAGWLALEAVVVAGLASLRRANVGRAFRAVVVAVKALAAAEVTRPMM
ncbi:MAG: hypothetical protein AAGD11_07290 [Planctomycetota bacterium]